MTVFDQAAIVIPAFNEATRIPWVIDTAKESVNSGLIHPEIIVIDNNSVDETSDIAKAMGATVFKCALQGKGWAMRTGVDYAKYLGVSTVTFLDADLKHLTPSHINQLTEPVLRREAVMNIGYLGGRPHLFKKILQYWGAFSGQRAVSIPEIWDYIRPYDLESWRTEGAMNAIARNRGIGSLVMRTELDGLRHVGSIDREGSLTRGLNSYRKKYTSATRGLLSLSGR